MADLNGGQIIARQLKAAGIDTAFGVVAGPMIEVMAAMEREGIKVVNCRHEVSAGFAASAWGWARGKPGVLVVGSGPALTNAVTPMYVATESAMPLVVLGGSSAGNQRGLGAFQEADQVAFAAPACKWATQVDSQARIAEYVHLALGRALNGRPGAVYLDFPAELIRTPFDEEAVQWRTSDPEISRPHPDPAALEAVADMLTAAERPLVIMGKGAGWAEAGLPLQRLVDRGIPFVSSPMGRGSIPDDHPMFMNATRSAALGGADAVLMVGGRFNWVFQFGQPPRFAEGVRLAHIDIVAEEFYSGADVETGIVADCAIAVEQLNGLLEGRSLRVASSDWVATLAEGRSRNEASSEEAMASDEVPINHFRLLRDVRDSLDRDATVTVDAELTMGVARAVMPSFGSRLRLNSGTTGCMGTGLPYAIGGEAGATGSAGGGRARRLRLRRRRHGGRDGRPRWGERRHRRVEQRGHRRPLDPGPPVRPRRAPHRRPPPRRLRKDRGDGGRLVPPRRGPRRHRPRRARGARREHGRAGQRPDGPEGASVGCCVPGLGGRQWRATLEPSQIPL